MRPTYGTQILKYSSFKFFFKKILYVCVLPHVYGCPWRLEEGAGASWAGVIGGSEAPDVDAGNWIQAP